MVRNRVFFIVKIIFCWVRHTLSVYCILLPRKITTHLNITVVGILCQDILNIGSYFVNKLCDFIIVINYIGLSGTQKKKKFRGSCHWKSSLGIRVLDGWEPLLAKYNVTSIYQYQIFSDIKRGIKRSFALNAWAWQFNLFSSLIILDRFSSPVKPYSQQSSFSRSIGGRSCQKNIATTGSLTMTHLSLSIAWSAWLPLMPHNNPLITWYEFLTPPAIYRYNYMWIYIFL